MRLGMQKRQEGRESRVGWSEQETCLRDEGTREMCKQGLSRPVPSTEKVLGLDSVYSATKRRLDDRVVYKCDPDQGSGEETPKASQLRIVNLPIRLGISLVSQTEGQDRSMRFPVFHRIAGTARS